MRFDWVKNGYDNGHPDKTLQKSQSCELGNTEALAVFLIYF